MDCIQISSASVMPWLRSYIYSQQHLSESPIHWGTCCDKIDMTNLFLSTHNKKTKNIRDDPITTHTSPRWTHTIIGPSDQSEEAHPSVTIDRRQTEGNMREKSCKGILTFTQKPWTRWNKQSDTVTVGTTMNQSTMLLGTSNRGSFTLPCIPFLSLSSP